jgi:hypothetical protein
MIPVAIVDAYWPCLRFRVSIFAVYGCTFFNRGRTKRLPMRISDATKAGN